MRGPGEGADRGLAIAVEGILSQLGAKQLSILLDRSPTEAADLSADVARVISDVRDRGDEALFEMAERFDRVSLQSVEVPRDRWTEAMDSLGPAVRRALLRAAGNIEAFHRAQIPANTRLEVEPGVLLERRWAPLPSVGVYAPGGLAAYPSSVLMGVVPARTAGVEEIILCSPPGESGLPSAEVLAAAEIAGASRVFAIGGAGAVGAMALGTETVPSVAAIVGPGNRWVTEAKRQVAGQLLIDSPAGPSEVLVVATAPADPVRVALELVAQAEHDPEAAAVLVTPSPELASSVRRALEELVEAAPRRGIIEKALASRGGIVVTDTLEEALSFARAYAAEHLALFTDDRDIDLHQVSTAGTIFVGTASSVAFGDYMTGANHVLPTGGMSRAFSGLSVVDFLRSYTVQTLTSAGASAMAGDVAILAEAEGLPGHAAAARARGGAA